jgi:hypothetical protein
MEKEPVNAQDRLPVAQGDIQQSQKDKKCSVMSILADLSAERDAGSVDHR